MTLVAMAITVEQWGQLMVREMDDNNSRILFLLVQQQTLEKALVFEYQSGARDTSSKPPAKSQSYPSQSSRQTEKNLNRVHEPGHERRRCRCQVCKRDYWNHIRNAAEDTYSYVCSSPIKEKLVLELSVFRMEL